MTNSNNNTPFLFQQAFINKQPFYGYWCGDEKAKITDYHKLSEKLYCLDTSFCLVQKDETIFIAEGGSIVFNKDIDDKEAYLLLAYVPPQSINSLGNSQFCLEHKVKYPYMSGSMANGISSIKMVEALANENILASFGSAGLSISEVESAINQLKRTLGDKTYCFNLIYSPNEKGYEKAIVELYLKYKVRLVEASAYMKLTLPVVYYRVKGIYKDAKGNIIVPNKIIAKASRIEIAEKWFSPPPEKILKQLVDEGLLSLEEMELAKHIPMAQDLTVEADSGGHTDNRPAITLLPAMLDLCNRLQDKYKYDKPLRVGAAGGIASPLSALGAFAMGASYIVTGTINQSCVESGSSNVVRRMLASTEQADVIMAPAVDMFEIGVKLQVLKRGTLFAMRANKLYEIYKQYDSIDEIPTIEKEKLEKTIFRMSVNSVWKEVKEYFHERDSSQIDKAIKNPKHKMALIFRWYLGLSSRWANIGDNDRQADYQIWCGPSMGAFNEWVLGTFLAEPQNRDVVTIAMNLLFGAAVLSRFNLICKQNLVFSTEMFIFKPKKLDKIISYL